MCSVGVSVIMIMSAFLMSPFHRHEEVNNNILPVMKEFPFGKYYVEQSLPTSKIESL